MNLRLNTEDIAHAPRLVPILLVRLTDSVDVVHTDNPLVLGQVDLADEVVQVGDHAGKDLAVAGLGVRAHQVDDILSEVRVEVTGGPLVGRHGGCVNMGYLLRKEEEGRQKVQALKSLKVRSCGV